MAGDQARTFSFQYLDGKKCSTLESKETQDHFLKWSMKDRIRAQSFSFDQPFQVYQKEEFVNDFFKDPVVLSNLQVLTSSGKWGPLGTMATSVSSEMVPCTILSMTFFDRLVENNIVRDSGYIQKCMDEFYDDFTIADELRKLLLLEDSDNFCLYVESEREEFLFRLFRHICLGGQVCQYEDKLDPYLDTTKSLYKDLISVQKIASTKELNITSSVFSVTVFDENGAFYPSDKPHEQTFAYLIVDPLKRHATVLYHKFGAS